MIPLPDVGPTFTRLSERIALRTATVSVVGLGYVGLPLLVPRANGASASSASTPTPRRSRCCDAASRTWATFATRQVRELPEARFVDNAITLLVADVVIIAVPTPLKDGGPDLSLVERAVADVAETLRPGQLIVLESTTYPGTIAEVVTPILEGRGCGPGSTSRSAYSPERIDPGSGRRHPDGAEDRVGRRPGRPRPRRPVLPSRRLPHGARPVAARGRDGQAHREHVPAGQHRARQRARDRRGRPRGRHLGCARRRRRPSRSATSRSGPVPGSAGHCIAIDPTYLSWRAQQRRGFGLGFVQHALEVNNGMPAYVASRVGEALNAAAKPVRGSKVLALGMSYKPGVDDVRESPARHVARTARGRRARSSASTTRTSRASPWVSRRSSRWCSPTSSSPRRTAS